MTALATTATSSATDLSLSIFPNPTTGAATMAYYLPTAANVTVDVSDALGRRVVTIATEQHQGVGQHTLTVPTLSQGVYLVRLLYNGITEYRKLSVE